MQKSNVKCKESKMAPLERQHEGEFGKPIPEYKGGKTLTNEKRDAAHARSTKTFPRRATFYFLNDPFPGKRGCSKKKI